MGSLALMSNLECNPKEIEVGKSYAFKIKKEVNEAALEKLLSLGLILGRDESPVNYKDYYFIADGIKFDVVQDISGREDYRDVTVTTFNNYYNQLKNITTSTAPKIEEFREGISYFKDVKWFNFSKDTNYFDFVTAELYRVLPVRKTSKIVEYPEPLKDTPKPHELFYYVDFSSEDSYLIRFWSGDEEDINILKNGAAFSTKEQVLEYIQAYKQAFNIN